MSLKSFNAFMAKVNAEETLRNELKQANPDGMTIDALAAVAAQHGFHFDAQDVSNELSEKELDLVAGGMDIIGPLRNVGSLSSSKFNTGGASILDKHIPSNVQGARC